MEERSRELDLELGYKVTRGDPIHSNCHKLFFTDAPKNYKKSHNPITFGKFFWCWKYHDDYDDKLAKIISTWWLMKQAKIMSGNGGTDYKLVNLMTIWQKWWQTGKNYDKLVKIMTNWQKLWQTGKNYDSDSFLRSALGCSAKIRTAAFPRMR